MPPRIILDRIRRFERNPNLKQARAANQRHPKLQFPDKGRRGRATHLSTRLAVSRISFPKSGARQRRPGKKRIPHLYGANRRTEPLTAESFIATSGIRPRCGWRRVPLAREAWALWPGPGGSDRTARGAQARIEAAVPCAVMGCFADRWLGWARIGPVDRPEEHVQEYLRATPSVPV